MGRLVLIHGRDSHTEIGGGNSYVYGHALAAKRVGYDPHVYGLWRRSEIVVADFGTQHRCFSPLPRLFRTIHARAQRRWLVRQIVRDLRDEPGPHVIHGFTAWADSAVAASRALARKGVHAVPVGTAWTTAEHEGAAKFGSQVMRNDLRPARRDCEQRRRCVRSQTNMAIVPHGVGTAIRFIATPRT